MLETLMLPATAADDAGLVCEICELVKRAYVAAEPDLWASEYVRTTPEDTAAAIAAEQVAVARADGLLLGSVRTRRLDRETGWFGCLAVDVMHVRRGVGGSLVRFVEERAARAGLLEMQLELLEPQGEPHGHLALLAAWYERLEYAEVDRGNLADVEPEAVPFLIRQVDLVICRKRLAPCRDLVAQQTRP